MLLLQSLLSTQVWLADVETRLHKNVELKDSLQEKRTQLQTRLALLQDVTSRQRAVESLAEKGQVLRASCGPNPEVETFITNAQEKYQSLLQQAKVSWQLVKCFLGNQKHNQLSPLFLLLVCHADPVQLSTPPCRYSLVTAFEPPTRPRPRPGGHTHYVFS